MIDSTRPPRRGIGDSTLGRIRAEHERSAAAEVVTSTGLLRGFGPTRKSEGSMVPEKPVKAGGGMGPWFWARFSRRRESGDWET